NHCWSESHRIHFQEDLGVKATFLVFVTIILFCGSVALAQTVDELINKNIEAHGGVEKLKSVNTVKMSGKMSMAGGIEAPFTFQKKRPDKIKIEFVIQGMTGIQAYDGSTAWTLMPFTGNKDPQKMPEEDRKDIIEQADFDGPLVDYRAKGNVVEYVGKEDVEGTEAHKLKLTLKSGNVRYLFLDPETGLEIKATAMIKREGVEASVDSFFGDYKEVDGIIFPFVIEQKIQGQPGPTFSVEKLDLDVDLEDSLFVMPEGKPQTQRSQ
ncbi:MAG: hypothetical protein ACRD4B_04075, partial [Acidobacteriota bacterium]